MLNVIGGSLVVVLVGTTGWLLRRRGDVLGYHQTDTVANRVGRTWLWARHGGR